MKRSHRAALPPTDPSRTTPARRIATHVWRQWIRPFALLFLIMAPLRSAVLDWNWVPSGSMKPTILEGELVLVNKLAYDLKIPFTTRHVSTWSQPARGDVAVFFSPQDGTRLVKRVIGLPGDTIELRNEVLYLNGAAQTYSRVNRATFGPIAFEDENPIFAVEHLPAGDHYVLVLPGRQALRSFGPYVVPPDRFFMMGDSRDNSFDSRFFGPVSRREVVGRATTVLVSCDPSRYLRPRFNRFLQSLSIDRGGRPPSPSL